MCVDDVIRSLSATLGRSDARVLGRSGARTLGRLDARGMLALYREAYKKKSDVMALNKITLTQKNCQYEMFKFYKEHLHPLSPIPSFRHMLMWALQSSLYVMDWQFSFNGTPPPGAPFGTPPPGAPPPAYRAAEANAMAEEKSDGELTAAQGPARPRSRYVDDEAAESRWEGF